MLTKSIFVAVFLTVPVALSAGPAARFLANSWFKGESSKSKYEGEYKEQDSLLSNKVQFVETTNFGNFGGAHGTLYVEEGILSKSESAGGADVVIVRTSSEGPGDVVNSAKAGLGVGNATVDPDNKVIFDFVKLDQTATSFDVTTLAGTPGQTNQHVATFSLDGTTFATQTIFVTDPGGSTPLVNLTVSQGESDPDTTLTDPDTPPNDGNALMVGWQQFANTAPANILFKREEVQPLAYGRNSWGVIAAWSGAAFDPARRVFYMHGGGHEMYGGNEIYAFYADEGRWERLTSPSPLAQDPAVDPETQGNCWRPTDGDKPQSVHTYDGLAFTPLTGDLVRWGESPFPHNSTPDYCPAGDWAFNIESRTWRRIAPWPQSYGRPTRTAINPENGRVIVSAWKDVFEYDPVSDTYGETILRHGSSGAGVAAIDQSRGVMLISDQTGYYTVDYSTGALKYVIPKTDFSQYDPRKVGFDYSPTRDLWVLWGGDGDVYTLNPETWEVRLYRHTGVVPTPYGAGVYGRWRYVESLDAFVGFNNPAEDVWIYKLPEGDGEPLNVGSIETCLPDGVCTEFKVLQAAIDASVPGSTVTLSPDDFYQCATVRIDNITIGGPGAHLRNIACGIKAALVVNGNNVTIRDIECSGISVSSENGACIRLQAAGLTVRNVYFHDNDEGILGGEAGGPVIIEDSVFERNGRGGQAHGVYISGRVDRLEFRRNSILSSKGEGHELKSLAAVSIIEDNTLAGLAGDDSRAIDLPLGGVIVIRNNTIQKGPNSVNRNIIGIGYSDTLPLHDVHSFEITGNTFVCDLGRNCGLFTTGRQGPLPEPVDFSGNTIIGPTVQPVDDVNEWFTSRSEAGWAAYPELPPPR